MGQEHVEGEFTVPVATTYSVALGTDMTTGTITMGAGANFMTEYLAEFETELNDNFAGYPGTAAAMQAAVGYGRWTGGTGWLINETLGNLTAAYAGPSLTATGSPTYVAGPRGGTDRAVAFDTASGANYFNGGDIYDADVAGDLVIAIVFKVSTVASGGADVIGKGYGGGLPGYLVVRETADLALYVHDGVDEVRAAATGLVADTWYVAICALSRTTNQSRIGFAPLGGAATVSAATSTAAVGTLANALNFKLGNNNVYNSSAGTLSVSALYVDTGPSAAGTIVANMSAAVESLADAVNASWSVTRSTTTNTVTIANSFWPCSVDATAATLDAIGFQYAMNYPTTAAQMATALGYGTWTSGAGYLCNEGTGDLASMFGTPATLTAVASPTYGSQGPRGGNDWAVGFDSATDAFSAGDNFDVGASDDMLIVWVAQFSTQTPPVSDFLTKYPSATPYWYLSMPASNYRLAVDSGSGVLSSATAALPTAGAWHVGIAYIDRAAGFMGCGWRTIGGTSQTSTPTSVAALGSLANAASMFMGDEGLGFNAAPQTMKVAALYMVTGSGVAAGLNANLSTALSNFATYMKSQTGTEAPIGTWTPGCNIQIDGDPNQAPTGDDRMASISPTGRVYSLASSEYFRHRNLRWPAVGRGAVWETETTTPGDCYETFYLETQLAHHSWFSVGSRVKVYWDNAGVSTELGNGAVSAWSMPQCVTLDELQLLVPDWTGLYVIRFGDMYAFDS